MKPIGFESLFVYNGGVITSNNTETNSFYWFSNSRGIDTDTVTKDVMLYDENHSVKYKLTLTVSVLNDNARIDNIIVYENRDIYTKSDEENVLMLTGQEFIFQESYSDGVLSNVPVYLDERVLLITFENEVLAGEKRMIISEISIAETDINCKEYRYIKPTRQNNYEGRVLERRVYTMHYSNIPGEYVTTSGALMESVFSLSIPIMDQYGYYNGVKYIENSFVNPRYTTKNGKYLTVVEKPNQNITTTNVVLRNTYAIGHVDTSYNIANSIQSNTEHVMESVNKDYLLIGGVNKSGLLQDIAINCNSVSIVPLANKMMLSMEFT
jgi:hypothetical protein